MSRAEQTATLRRQAALAITYSNGIATYLEVLVTQSNVLQSELQLAGIIKSRLDATVDLYRSVGGGWTKSKKPNNNQWIRSFNLTGP